MNIGIFDFDDYRKFLLKKAGEQGRKNGIRSSWARVIGCQPTYISQVLNGKQELSLEQAEVLSGSLELTKQEIKYFLLLVSRQRAGTPSLRKHYQDQISEVIKDRMSVTKRLGDSDKQLSIEQKQIYYSNWQYAAFHIAVTVPIFRKPENLSTYFGVPIQAVVQILDF